MTPRASQPGRQCALWSAAIAFASATLAALGCPVEPGQTVRVSIEGPAGSTQFIGGAPRCRDEEEEALPEPERPPAVPPAWQWFSTTEKRIVASATADWMSAEKIAKAAGLELTNELKAIFRNLVARGVLLASTNRGHKLNLPDGAGEPPPAGD